MTQTDEHKNFLGIPIEGEIVRASSRKPQQPKELLQEALALLIAHPKFESMRWRQYTPYFNDGDPCVFNIYEVYFRFVGFPPLTEDEIGGYEEEDGYVDLGWTKYMSKSTPGYDDIIRVLGKPAGYQSEQEYEIQPEDPELIALAKIVSEMITSGAHYDFLLESFGDHAKVTVHKDKIDVEFYEHD